MTSIITPVYNLCSGSARHSTCSLRASSIIMKCIALFVLVCAVAVYAVPVAEPEPEPEPFDLGGIVKGIGKVAGFGGIIDGVETVAKGLGLMSPVRPDSESALLPQAEAAPAPAVRCP